MIDIKIHTNRDIGRMVEWPKKMACRPQVGDAVSSLCGRVELRVVKITHHADRDDPYHSYLIVEVNK